MNYHFTSEKNAYKKYTAKELRERFLLSGLFQPGEVSLSYTDVDRAIVGGLVPLGQALTLPEDRNILGADFFAQRREIGIINRGGSGSILVDGDVYEMNFKDSLYIGRGSKDIQFLSTSSDSPAQYFLTSYPAHKDYPVKHVSKAQANKLSLGSADSCNEREIFQSIVPGIVDTCQIVMGFTEIRRGSNWNTFPPHTHNRRMEVYSYFELNADQAVFHLMGTPDETRHIVVRDGEAVVSPSWSIHSGVGTSNYSFIWVMGGENQEFDDMDGLCVSQLG